MDAMVLNYLGDLAHEFEARGTGITPENLPAFLAWAAAKSAGTTPQSQEFAHQQASPDFMAVVNPMYVSIAKNVTLLYRYARYYTRTALEGLVLQSFDEFVYVAQLMAHPGLTKAELADMNVQERSTALELVSRLIKRGLVEQRKEGRDKREIALYLTDAGRASWFEALPRMNHTLLHMMGELPDDDLSPVARALEKLDTYHSPFFRRREAPPGLEEL